MWIRTDRGSTHIYCSGSSSSWAEVIFDVHPSRRIEASEMAGRLGRHGLCRKNGHKDILLEISCQFSSSCCSSVEFLLIPWANEQRSATVQHWDLTSFMSTGHKHPITHSGICQISQGGPLITSFKWTYHSYKIYKYIGSKPQITHLFQAIHFRAKTSTTPFL